MFGKRNSTQLPPVKRSGPAPTALPAAAAGKEPPKPMPQGQAQGIKPNPQSSGKPNGQDNPGKGRNDLPAAKPAEPPKAKPVERKHSEEYYDIKTTVFNALIDTIDLTQLAKLDAEAAREEIRDIVAEIIQVKNVVMSIARSVTEGPKTNSPATPCDFP